MKKITKLFLFIGILLCLVSIHDDLTGGTVRPSDLNHQDHQPVNQSNLTASKVQVQRGDTVLSIVEQLNNQEKTTDQQNIPKIMTDFKTLNPDISPLEIREGDYYYFPVYKSKSISRSIYGGSYKHKIM